MDAKVKYKAKKIKAVFFDIDDTLRRKATGLIPDSIPSVFAELKKKALQLGLPQGVPTTVLCQRFVTSSQIIL